MILPIYGGTGPSILRYNVDMKIQVKCDEPIRMIPIGDLRPNPRNPNHHNAKQIDRLIKLIEHQGWRKPIVVSNLSGLMTAGHGRLLAAIKMGLEEVPVNFQDYDSSGDEYADLVADNAIALWAELDMAGINQELPDLGPDLDIDLLGVEGFMLDPSELQPEDPDAKPDKKSKSVECPSCGHVFAP